MSPLDVLNDGRTHMATEIAEAVGCTVKSVGQLMRRHVADGTVERLQVGGAPAYRLASQTEREVAVLDELQPIEAETTDDAPPLSFAVWDDGALTITRGQESLFLAPGDVDRLRTHLGRFA